MSTTIYDVITRYRVDDGNATARVGALTGAARGATTGLVGLRGAAISLAPMLRMVGTAAGFASVGAAGVFALTKSFSGLNEQVVRTNQLAAALSNFFRFSTDPAENFSRAMGKARSMVNQLIRDAALLPGEARDFFQIMSLLAGPTFAGGGGPEQLRSLTKNVALAAPFAMQSPSDAANQAFRMLSGQAGVGDNPLFASLVSMGFLPKAGIFNKLPPSERLVALDAALTKLAGNPFFRAEVTKQFDVQLGTLSDVLFGPQGIGGQAFRSTFEGLGSTLADLNETLTKNVPAIVGWLRLIGFGAEGAGRAIFGLPADLLGKIFGGFGERRGLGFGETGYVNMSARDALKTLVGEDDIRLLGEGAKKRQLFSYFQNLFNAEMLAPGSIPPGTTSEAIRAAAVQLGGRKIIGINANPNDITAVSPTSVARMVSEHFDRLLAPAGDPERANPVQGKTVYNTIHIKVDLKSDDSPEAVALKIGEGMKKLSRRRTRSDRTVAITVDPRSQ